MVTAIANEGASVLVHCSDGWDRTAQMSGVFIRLLIGLRCVIRLLIGLAHMSGVPIYCSYGLDIYIYIYIAAGMDAIH